MKGYGTKTFGRLNAERYDDTVADIAADPERWIPPQVVEAAYTNWVSIVIGESDVHVASQIGTWFPLGDGIIPPPVSP